MVLASSRFGMVAAAGPKEIVNRGTVNLFGVGAANFVLCALI
jgi:hypothetical protein